MQADDRFPVFDRCRQDDFIFIEDDRRIRKMLITLPLHPSSSSHLGIHELISSSESLRENWVAGSDVGCVPALAARVSPRMRRRFHCGPDELLIGAIRRRGLVGLA